jgi:predicted site-specific integrase-resolvase
MVPTENTDMKIELLNPREVGLLLCYSYRRVLKLARDGRIPYVILPDGDIRFEKSAIDRLIEQGRHRGESNQVSMGATV